jgi:hypothetical protein
VSPRPRRHSSTTISPAGLAVVVAAGAAAIVAGAAFLYEHGAGRDDADRLRGIGREMKEAAEERGRIEEELRATEPAAAGQPEHVLLLRYRQDDRWRTAALRLSNLEAERRRILRDRPDRGP